VIIHDEIEHFIVGPINKISSGNCRFYCSVFGIQKSHSGHSCLWL